MAPERRSKKSLPSVKHFVTVHCLNFWFRASTALLQRPPHPSTLPSPSYHPCSSSPVRILCLLIPLSLFPLSVSRFRAVVHLGVIGQRRITARSCARPSHRQLLLLTHCAPPPAYSEHNHSSSSPHPRCTLCIGDYDLYSSSTTPLTIPSRT